MHLFSRRRTAVAEWIYLGALRSNNPNCNINLQHIKDRAHIVMDGLVDIVALNIPSNTDFTLTKLTKKMVEGLAQLTFSVSALEHKQGEFYTFMRELDFLSLFEPLGALLHKLEQVS